MYNQPRADTEQNLKKGMIMLLPGDLKNINELILYLRQELAHHPENMSLKQQENVAIGVVGLMVNEEFDKWRREYPILDTIWDIAVDLEWSNVGSLEDASESWRVIARMVDELEQQVNAAN